MSTVIHNCILLGLNNPPIFKWLLEKAENYFFFNFNHLEQYVYGFRSFELHKSQQDLLRLATEKLTRRSKIWLVCAYELSRGAHWGLLKKQLAAKEWEYFVNHLAYIELISNCIISNRYLLAFRPWITQRSWRNRKQQSRPYGKFTAWTLIRVSSSVLIKSQTDVAYCFLGVALGEKSAHRSVDASVKAVPETEVWCILTR